MTIKIYQTISYVKEQSEAEILAEGPYKCTKENSWLGDGYYFWDTYKELAKGWGRLSYSNRYRICRAYITSDDRCFDLRGNNQHREDFREIFDWLRAKNPDEERRRNMTVKDVLFAMEKKVGLRERFEGIRLDDVYSMGRIKDKYNHVPVSIIIREGEGWKMLTRPTQIQICLFFKESLDFRDYEVVSTKAG